MQLSHHMNRKLMKKPKIKKLKKRISKIPKPNLKRFRPNVEQRYQEAVEDVPKITNDTVAEHREAVLSQARKFIYPLQYSKHRIVILSSGIFAAAVLLLFSYCGLALYRFQTTSTFMYDVTQIIPFPIAKAGPRFVSYNSYLFEVRRYMHYYQTQQQVNFGSPSGKAQLNRFKQQAMTEVIDNAYVKQLASQNDVTVSSSEVNNEISLFQNQNRLGSSQAELKTVLSEFWGWSINDFKVELTQQLLTQKVLAKLDTNTEHRAQTALAAIQNGADFSSVAQNYSDDLATKNNGGQFTINLTGTNNIQVPAQTIATLESLKPGETSGVINVGTGLEIDKLISISGNQIQAAHILFNFEPLSSLIGPLQAKQKPRIFIGIPPSVPSA
jgi:foldase protein PrsA